MDAFIVMMNLFLAARADLYIQYGPNIPLIKLFGVSPIFIMKFFGGLILLFAASALISYILKIDKASKE
jgi:hypothetical protein